MSTTSPFIFATCQQGAEDALKCELERRFPEVRLAFSRPGFLTFKLPDEQPADEQLCCHRAAFARACGISLGKVTGGEEELAAAFWNLVAPEEFHALHLWPRDPLPVGKFDFEPHIPPEIESLAARLAMGAPSAAARELAESYNQPASRGQQVLDGILVEPDELWVGAHRCSSQPTRFPGGIMPIELPEHAVSRAYRKLSEALAWSRLPTAQGDPCVELGSAPGGASQALLEHGLIVNGIDPAEMDPAVLAHPNFRHLKMRGADLKRREYQGVRWLFADMNVVPEVALRTVESIVTYRGVHIRGFILMLKLRDWELAEEIPAYLERIRGWGYRDVRARQLAFNRREICVAGLKRKALRRLGRPVRRRKRRGDSHHS